MYLKKVAAAIRDHIPKDRLPEGEANELLLIYIYAVLLRAKGESVTHSDVHDAWSAWMVGQNPDHESLVPYSDLPEEVRNQDAVFTAAIRRASAGLENSESTRPSFLEILFPSGPPADDKATQQTLDLYKIMVASSEALVGRRQAVNTFFLTINGALLTASGLILQRSGSSSLIGLALFILAVTGALLCGAWRSLIISFGQLNRGKFQVINTMERFLTTAIYAAEWEALGRGENPTIYRSFTSREIWVPNALLTLHICAAIAILLFTVDYVYLLPAWLKQLILLGS